MEPALVAAATGEADAPTAARVREHVGACASCRAELARYRALDAAVGTWRRTPAPAAPVHARHALESRLAELRRRALAYHVFASPLGCLLIARSEDGVALVEYLAAPDLRHSRLRRLPDTELVSDGAELQALYQELLEYLQGRRTRLDWALDLRLARSGFHRAVLEATAAVPYGAVVSYTGIAREIGKPSATRAVAQALRWNPVPIVVPCHRIVGLSGRLTGYAGDRVELKHRLLAVEGVPATGRRAESRIARDRMYVSDDGHWYCLPTCPSMRDTGTVPHRMLFGRRHHAEAAGLVPCDTCHPELHPLD
jgi:O-6-methylguanine DNA methyltransferase